MKIKLKEKQAEAVNQALVLAANTEGFPYRDVLTKLGEKHFGWPEGVSPKTAKKLKVKKVKAKPGKTNGVATST
jgi:hypothetical protein